MFDKMKQLYELKKQAEVLRKELQGLTVEAEGGRGAVKMTMNGEMKIQSLAIAPEWLAPDRKSKLEEAIKECLASGLEKAQRAAASKMGGLNQLLGRLKG